MGDWTDANVHDPGITMLQALAWSIAALVIAPLPRRYWNHALIAGPLLITLGLAGIALALPPGRIAWIALWTAVMGAGYGVCWAFLGQRIMACARPGEGGRAAASIATMEVTGLALGAALAGVMGSALGLGVAPEAVSLVAIAGPGHASFLLIMLLLVVAAVRLVRCSPPLGGTPSSTASCSRASLA